MEDLKKFTDFLVRKKCFNKFILELTFNFDSLESAFEFLSRFKHEFLFAGFVWSNSVMGYDFWSNINDEWLFYYSEEKYGKK